MKTMNSNRIALARSKGFTLIEIMVVVVILGVLATLAAPALFENVDKSNITAAKSNMRQLSSALDMYKLDNFNYPSTEQGLEALVSKPGGSPEPRNYRTKGYMKKLPLDPWGRDFIYVETDGEFEIICLGKDGKEGGEGTNADISSNDL